MASLAGHLSDHGTRPREIAPARKAGRVRGVAPADARRWRGVTYDSKAEMLRAKAIEADPLVAIWIHQPKIYLTDSVAYRPDFFILAGVADRPGRLAAWFEDVKGYPTDRFKVIAKLWRDVGPADLHVVYSAKRRTEIIEGGRPRAIMGMMNNENRPQARTGRRPGC